MKQINKVLLCGVRAAACGCEHRVKVVPMTRPDLPGNVRLGSSQLALHLCGGVRPSGGGGVAVAVVLWSLRDVVLTRGCGWSFRAVVAIQWSRW